MLVLTAFGSRPPKSSTSGVLRRALQDSAASSSEQKAQAKGVSSPFNSHAAHLSLTKDWGLISDVYKHFEERWCGDGLAVLTYNAPAFEVAVLRA